MVWQIREHVFKVKQSNGKFILHESVVDPTNKCIFCHEDIAEDMSNAAKLNPSNFIHVKCLLNHYCKHRHLRFAGRFHPFHSQLFHPFTSNSPIPSAIYRSCCPHCKEEEEKKKEENKKTCTVCFEDVVKGMPNTATLKCSHTFHLDCLLKSYREQEHNQSVLCIYILFHPIVFFIH